MNLEHCPQRALERVAKLFEDKAPEKGDANTCHIDVEEAIGKATETIYWMRNSYDSDAIYRLTKAIGHLMVALQTITDLPTTIRTKMEMTCRVEHDLCSDACDWITLEDGLQLGSCALFGTEIKEMKRCERCLATFKENK